MSYIRVGPSGPTSANHRLPLLCHRLLICSVTLREDAHVLLIAEYVTIPGFLYNRVLSPPQMFSSLYPEHHHHGSQDCNCLRMSSTNSPSSVTNLLHIVLDVRPHQEDGRG
jgi:hypothetical protein